MNFNPTVTEALNLRKTCTISDKRWLRYAPAYVVTNEKLHNEMAFMPKNCDKALTVAASGDHPLFCKLYGVKHVTTFDITCHAKIITDIKIAALHELNIDEYWQLLSNLYGARDVVSVPNMNKIMPHLSPVIQTYLMDAPKMRTSLFSCGHNITSYIQDNVCVSDYQKLKNLVEKPFDFMWDDVIDLQLTEKYDFIHLSNISDYISCNDMGKVLVNMINHTNVGGCILAQQQNRPDAELLCSQIPKQLPNWKLLSHGHINVLQRVR